MQEVGMEPQRGQQSVGRRPSQPRVSCAAGVGITFPLLETSMPCSLFLPWQILEVPLGVVGNQSSLDWQALTWIQAYSLLEEALWVKSAVARATCQPQRRCPWWLECCPPHSFCYGSIYIGCLPCPPN